MIKRRSKLYSIFLALALWALAGVNVTAFAEFTVSRASVTEAVIAHVKRAAEEQGVYNPKNDDIQVRIPHIPSQEILFTTGQPDDTPDIRVTSSLSQYFTPHSLAQVSVTLPNGECQQVSVPVRVAVVKTVWVVKQQMRPNEPFTSRNIEQQEMVINQQFDDIVAGSTPLRQKTPRLVLIPGTILKKSQLTNPIAVKSQGFVRIVMNTGAGVRMVLEGKALEDGHVGDVIRVRNRYNRDKLYTAKVIGQNRVAVHLQ